MTTKDETKAREALAEAEIDAIEARANAATRPPWRTTGDVLRYAIASATDEDAEFIGHARTDIPILLAEVRRLRAALASAERVGAEGALERAARVVDAWAEAEVCADELRDIAAEIRALPSSGLGRGGRG